LVLPFSGGCRYCGRINREQQAKNVSNDWIHESWPPTTTAIWGGSASSCNDGKTGGLCIRGNVPKLIFGVSKLQYVKS
jgi:hypothetical protein